MEPAAHKQILQEIMGNVGNQAKISELLTSLSDDYGAVIAENEKVKEQAAKLTADNQGLRDTNNRLFLRVGHQPAADPAAAAQSENGIPKIKLEDLFNEKGELK